MVWALGLWCWVLTRQWMSWFPLMPAAIPVTSPVLTLAGVLGLWPLGKPQTGQPYFQGLRWSQRWWCVSAEVITVAANACSPPLPRLLFSVCSPPLKGIILLALGISVLLPLACTERELLNEGLLGSGSSRKWVGLLLMCRSVGWVKCLFQIKKHQRKTVFFSEANISRAFWKWSLLTISRQNHHYWLLHLRCWISTEYIHFTLLNDNIYQVWFHCVKKTPKKTLPLSPALLVFSPPLLNKVQCLPEVSEGWHCQWMGWFLRSI